MIVKRRAVNDYRRRTFGRQAQRVIAFVCECANEHCRRSVLLTPGEFDELRSAARPVVIDAHARPAEPRDPPE
jgi:hypothetical protein